MAACPPMALAEPGRTNEVYRLPSARRFVEPERATNGHASRDAKLVRFIMSIQGI